MRTRRRIGLLAELQRRKVIRAAVVYAASAFVVLQAADLILPALMLPEWTYRLLVLLALLGFPITLGLAWALEVTSDGVRVTPRRTGAHDDEPPPSLLGRRTVIAATLLIVLGVGLGTGWFLRPVTGSGDDRTNGAPDKSIAVLPFADFSPGGDHDWFADGLAEEILNALARLPDLRVASRTGSFQFREQGADVGAIAASLGVAHILEGSVRRAGDQVRITAQLWSQTFDRDAADVIRVQEEIAYEIARTLRTALDPGQLARMVAAGTNSVRGPYAKAVDTLLRDWERMVTFFEFPKEHWIHLRTTNVVESRFASVRLRTTAAKRYKRVENASALIWKLLCVAQKTFRRLNAPHLLAVVAAGAKYVDGVAVTPHAERVAA